MSSSTSTSSGPSTPALEIINLVKRYPTGTEALKGVSLEIADGEPVMWVNGSMLSTGPLGYLEPDVMDWNEALVEACQAYPGLRVYDWNSEVNPDWYTDDGIHYTPIGYGERARLIADGLIAAFPGDQELPTATSEPAEDCLVGTGQVSAEETGATGTTGI